jgi:DNA (cytosine-5)-methyltransferase 1
MEAAKVIDLFCGCGGLSLGFQFAGFDVVAGFDNWEPCIKTYSKNVAPGFKADLREVKGEDLLALAGVTEVDGIIGGPPCEGFSLANIKRSVGDPRNMLIFHFARLVGSIRPTFFVMENVVGLLSLGGGMFCRELLRRFRKLGYKIGEPYILNAADYGVPQMRKRVIFMGSLSRQLSRPKVEYFPYPSITLLGERKERYVTAWEAISDLPPPTKDGIVYYQKEPENWYQEYVRNKSGKTTGHILTQHRTDIIEKLRRLKPGEPLYPNFRHSWVRLVPDQPAPTVKENHNAPAVHPFEPRILTPRECARLQSFPDSFDFPAPKSIQLKLVGDSVPPLLAKAIAKEVAGSLR